MTSTRPHPRQRLRDPALGSIDTRTVAPAADGQTARHASGLQVAILALLAIAIALPLASTALGLYDTLTNWGKLVHAVDAACATFIVALLTFAWRDASSVDLTDELGTLVAMCAGMLFGVLWEIVEFIRDWVAYSDLQKSNLDTMTDLLVNDVAAVVAALLAIRLYHRATSAHKAALGRTAEWLVDGPSRLLDRHGFLIVLLAAVAIAGSIAALWFAGRPVPGIPIP